MRSVLLAVSLGASNISACSGPTEPAAVVRPPESVGHALVYATDLQLVLLVNAGLGGMSSPPFTTKTKIWAWNGTVWSVIDSSGPPIRNLAGVAFDSQRNTLVMHSGSYDLDHAYGDTWEWTKDGGWKLFTGAGPGVLDHSQMTYDSNRGVVVLFGGQSSPTSTSGDTWEFNGSAWTKVATTGPLPRVHHAMAYNAASKKTVLFGGYNPGGSDLGDTWEWDGATWTQSTGIAARTHATMAYDDNRQATVLLGSVSATTGIGAMVRSASTWQALGKTPEPPARYLSGAAFDFKRRVLVVFGGGDPAGNDLRNDTWELDAGGWRRAD